MATFRPAVLLFLATTAPAWALPGDLDPSFGSGGIVVEGGMSTGTLRARAVVIQPDDRIVIAGESNGLILVRRYLADGTPDPSFGTAGAATADPTAGVDQAFGVALHPDGPDLKIVAAGNTSTGRAAVVRFLPDGTLDATFDGDGIVEVDFGASAGAEAVVVQPDGRIVIAGGTSTPQVAVARLDLDGTLDTSFSGDGTVLTSVGGFCFMCQPDRAYDVALYQDGPDLKIVVVGEDPFAGSGSNFVLVRYMPDGSLDATFGVGGIVTTFPTPTNLSRLLGVAIQPDGGIVAAGAKSPSQFDSVVARYLPSGALDASFGGTGIVTTSVASGAFPAGFDQFDDVALQPDGSIVVTGFGRFTGALEDTTLARYSSTGALDATFGTGGIVTTVVSAAGDVGRAVALQDDGAIVVAGEITNGGGDVDLFVARYLGGGLPGCGDGTTDPGEDCDDGNTDDGDCCSSTCVYESTGSSCDDGDACSVGETCETGVCSGGAAVACGLCQACDAMLGCVDAPVVDCRGTIVPGKALLQLKDGTPDTKDAVAWKWTRGGATTVAELGTPAGVDDYALCVFDAADALLARLDAPAGGTCGDVACWAAVGGANPKGVRYRDRDGTPDGIGVLIAKAGAAGRAKVTLKAKGDGVPMPALGAIALPVLAQLRTSGGLCLEATFSSTGVIKSTSTELKVKSD